MISQAGSVAVHNSYASNTSEAKSAKTNAGANVSQQGDISKVDQLKESILSGEYKVNLEALSKKIAEELL